MRFNFTIFFFFLSMFSLLYSQTWEKVNSVFPENDSLGSHASITFANSDTGWLYSSLRINSNQDIVYKKLFRTTDGGKYWEKELSDVGGWDVYRIYARKPDFLFVLYGGGSILRTNNGGMSWDSSGFNRDLRSEVKQIHFFSDEKAIAFSEFRWFSYDGGYSWERAADSTVYWEVQDVYFIDEKSGWVVRDVSNVTDVGSILQTTDGGMTWHYQHDRAPLLYGVCFADSLNGFAVGTNRGFSSGLLCKTDDGGITWERIVLPGGPFWCVDFLDSLNGWIGGSGTILKTNDGGETWTIQIDTIETDYTQLLIFKEDKIAYFFGHDWDRATNTYINAYTLLKADLNSITSSKIEKNKQPETYMLLQNYPNPFNPATKISFQIPHSSFVSLKIYDILGNEVAILVNETKKTGEYEIEWSANNLSSGIYYCRLTSGRYMEIKKMLLVK